MENNEKTPAYKTKITTIQNEWDSVHEWLEAQIENKPAARHKDILRKIIPHLDTNLLHKIFIKEMIEDGYYENYQSTITEDA